MLSCLAAAAAAAVGEPQSLRFDAFKHGQGMDANINQIVQDSQGFIWLAGSNGLTRYDGYKAKTYKNVPSDPTSLTESWVYGLLADREGRLWVGTRGGLHLYDRANDRFIRYNLTRTNAQDALAQTIEVRRVVEDGKSGLWLTTNDGLRHFDPATGKFTSMVHDANDPSSLAAEGAVPAVCDAQGNLWVGTGRGLDYLAHGASGFIHYRLDSPEAPDMPSGNVQSLMIDDKGTLWVGTEKGLEAWQIHDGKPQRRRFGAAEGFQPQWIREIFQDKQGTIWLTSVGDGLLRWDPAANRFIAYRHRPGDPHSVPDNYLLSIFQDRAGTLWVGTFANGAAHVDLASGGFALLTRQSGDGKSLSSDKNRVILIDPAEKDRVWLATTDGLNMLDARTGDVSVFRHDTRRAYDPAYDRLTGLALDRQGRMWVLSELGLSRFDRAAGRFVEQIPFPADIPPAHNEFIRFDRNGMLWIGGGRGLYRYDPAKRSWRRFANVKDDPNSMAGDIALSMLEDSRGDIWVGTNRGLDKFDRTTLQFTHYQNQPGKPGSLSGKLINTIFEDRHGTVWVGSENGLNRMEKTKGGAIAFRAYPIDVVDAVLEDKGGTFWVGTDSGIVRLDPDTGAVKRYNEHDGTAEGGYYDGSAALADDGTIYFGSPNGLTIFHPDAVRDNPIMPIVQITDFQIFNKSVGVGQGPDGFTLPQSILQTKAVSLSYLHSVFSIEFAALHFADPERNQYAYRLEGFDKDWTFTDASRRIATYTNLDAGHYVFHVKAANKDGVWNETGATLDITIAPPFWKTWWFRLTMAALAIGCASLAYRLRVVGLLLQNAVLEEKIAQRTAEMVRQKALVERKNEDLEEANHELEVANESLAVANEIQAQQKSELTRFLAVASHDLRQPMHALNIYLGALLNVEVSTAARNLLGKVRQCATIMDDMFLALLDLSRLDAGVVQPNIKCFPIAPIFKTLAVEFAPQAEAKGLAFDCAPSDAWVESDAGLVQQILGNLIANAVRYTEKGHIHIRCTAVNGRLHVAVQDSGIGISVYQQKTIFEEYFQLGNSSNDRSKGIGLGLAIVKRLSILLDTPVTLVSEVGQGSIFMLDLPLAQGTNAPQDSIESEAKEQSNALEGKLIVVVDDDHSILDSMSILLELWGCRTVAAQSGAAAKLALGTMGGDAPDMIICDYRLHSGESGVDFITGLRDEFNRGIPALVITGDTTPDLIRDTLSSGLSVMYKPVRAQAVREALLRIFANRAVLI